MCRAGCTFIFPDTADQLCIFNSAAGSRLSRAQGEGSSFFDRRRTSTPRLALDREAAPTLSPNRDISPYIT